MKIREKIKLNLDEEFFKEEVRCDYKVTEFEKKIWAVELDLLNELIRVCKKHNIKMVVYAGTLLGAVRHKGMIPWDDDIDVALTRVEYEKLCKVALKEFKHPYFFQNDQTDPQYLYGYARLRNSLTTGHVIGEDNPNYNNGIYIDIFALDGYTDDEKQLIKQFSYQRQYYRIFNILKNNQGSKNKIIRNIRYVITLILQKTIFKLINTDKIVDKYMSSVKKYNDVSDKVSLITHNLSIVKKYWCYKKDLEEIVYIPFENMEVPAPKNYSGMLRNMYGDYMAFPPIEKRGVWHEGIIEFDPDTPYKEFIEKKSKRKL